MNKSSEWKPEKKPMTSAEIADMIDGSDWDSIQWVSLSYHKYTIQKLQEYIRNLELGLNPSKSELDEIFK